MIMFPCYGLNYTPPLYVEALSPIVMVFRDGAFPEVIKVKRGHRLEP